MANNPFDPPIVQVMKSLERGRLSTANRGFGSIRKVETVSRAPGTASNWPENVSELNDVDGSVAPADGDVLTFDDGLWTPQPPSGGGGGGGVLLLENGASVPGGTAVGTVVFEKAAPQITWDFKTGSLPAGWVKVSTPTETFSGAGMATTCAAGRGYRVPLAVSSKFTLELHLLTQASVTSIMFGPRAHDGGGGGAQASWYNAPNAMLTLGMNGYTYAGSYSQAGAGPPVYPTWIRLHRDGTSWRSSYSGDSGSTWSSPSPAITRSDVINNVGFGSILGTANATVQELIYTPEGAIGGGAKGWWDGSQLQGFA